MNPIDQAAIDNGISYIRYVDDMRILSSEVADCKKALMFIIQALRRRGLNLQTAKTEILAAERARTRIEGIEAVIVAVREKYKEFLTAIEEFIP